VAARILQADLIDCESLISDLVPFPGFTFRRYRLRIWCPDLASTPHLAVRNSCFYWPDFYNPVWVRENRAQLAWRSCGMRVALESFGGLGARATLEWEAGESVSRL